MADRYAALSNEVLVLLRSRRYEDAIKLVDGFASKDADEESQRLGLKSEVFWDAGEPAAAIDVVTRAVSLNPKNLANQYRLACYLFDSEDWTGALDVCDQLLRVSQEIGDSYFVDETMVRKSICLIELNKKTDALFLLAQLPDDLSVYIGDRMLSVSQVKSWC